MEHRPRLALCIVLAGASALFAANLGGYGLWPADEPRYGQVAREMMQSGNFLAPRVNGRPYHEKPPLLFWLIAAASYPFGDVTETSARIPSVAAALVTLALTYVLAGRLYGPRVALWSIIILATNTRFWWQARTVQIDMVLTACLALALLLFRLWHEKRLWPLLAGFYLVIAAAVYAKGPPGLVFPLLLIIVFYWKRREERRKTHWAIGLLAVVLLVGLWYVPARMSVGAAVTGGDETAISGGLFRQTIGRFILGVSHANPPWYYLETLPVDWLPWTFFLPYTALYVWRRRKEGPAMWLLLAWIVPAFFFFSISIGKRAIYLLPIFPAMSILIARSVLDLIDGERSAWRKRTEYVWAAALVVIAALPLAVLATEYHESFRPYHLTLTAVCAAFALASIVDALRNQGRRAHVGMAFGMAAVLAAAPFIVLPSIDPYKSAAPFCAPVRELAEKGMEFDLYSIGFSREEYVFYSKRFHTPLLTDILPITPLPGHEQLDIVREQVRLRKDLEVAVENIPAANDGTLLPEELEQLERAVQAVFEDAALSPELKGPFKDAVARELDALFKADRAVFAFAQEEDFDWLVVVDIRLRDLRILQRAEVGSRDVLLVANDRGAALLRAVGR